MTIFLVGGGEPSSARTGLLLRLTASALKASAAGGVRGVVMC